MKLAKRERLILILGGSILCLLLLWQLAISPAKDRVKELETKILDRKKDLEKVIGLQSEYLELKRKLDTVSEGLAARGENFDLFAFLEKLARESEVKEKLSDMKPGDKAVSNFYKEVSVKIELKEVTLKELIPYLYKIEEEGQFLSIDNLRIDSSPGSSEILKKVTFEVSTLAPL